MEARTEPKKQVENKTEAKTEDPGEAEDRPETETEDETYLAPEVGIVTAEPNSLKPQS